MTAIKVISKSNIDNARALSARETQSMTKNLLARAYLEINTISPIESPNTVNTDIEETPLELLARANKYSNTITAI